MRDETATASEFTAYYEKHSRAVFNYIFYRVNFNRDVAEDLTSEIFLKAFEHFAKYDRARPFKTWIFTIAHNHLINFIIGKKALLPLDEAKEIAKTVNISASLHNQLLIENLLSLISKLPDSERELVIMRYINDLSNREIAYITDKEEGAVRTALSRALSSLRNKYNLHYLKPTP